MKMVWNPEIAHNELPKLPPNKNEFENIDILKSCIPARAAVAELKQAGELLPNQELLINVIPLLEAKDSSEIENIVTTTDKLFQYAQEDTSADPATKEALSYRSALYQGFKQLESRPLCTNTTVEICSTLKSTEMDIRKVSGTTLSNSLTGETIYTPPEGEALIRDLLADWEKFMHDANDIDPLIKMALLHYQFEAIHPFSDGNGRTGRIANVLYLIEEKLLSLPILYLSRFIVQNKQDYYSLLIGVTRNGDWKSWIKFILIGVEETAKWTTNKIGAMRKLQEHTAIYVKQALPKIYTHELVEVIFTQPYCRINNLVKLDIAQRQTASQYLKQLVEIGVLKELSVGKEKLFVHPKLMKLVTKDSNEFVAYKIE